MGDEQHLVHRNIAMANKTESYWATTVSEIELHIDALLRLTNEAKYHIENIGVENLHHSNANTQKPRRSNTEGLRTMKELLPLCNLLKEKMDAEHSNSSDPDDVNHDDVSNC